MLQVGLYFSDAGSEESLERLLLSLSRVGNAIAEYAILDKRHGIRGSHFVSPYVAQNDGTISEDIHLIDLSELLETSSDSTRIREVGIVNATGSTPYVIEEITYCVLPKSCLERDHHAVQLLTDGEEFHMWMPNRPAGALRRGKIIREWFLRLVADAKPSYAAISTERDLASPCELRQEPWPFTDFFVDLTLVGADLTRHYQHADCVPIGSHGVAIFSSIEFTANNVNGNVSEKTVARTSQMLATMRTS